MSVFESLPEHKLKQTFLFRPKPTPSPAMSNSLLYMVIGGVCIQMELYGTGQRLVKINRKASLHVVKPIQQRAYAIRKVATVMLPFYRKLAGSRTFSVQWAKAVREADIARMNKLLRSVIGSEPLSALASNGVGWFVDFPLPKPLLVITNGTTIRPGQVQFMFSSTINRAIAKAVIPLYRELICNPSYTALVVKAINTQNETLLNHLIRSTVTSPKLVSVQNDFSGFFLGFKYPTSKYVYVNEVFREYVM